MPHKQTIVAFFISLPAGTFSPETVLASGAGFGLLPFLRFFINSSASAPVRTPSLLLSQPLEIFLSKAFQPVIIFRCSILAI